MSTTGGTDLQMRVMEWLEKYGYVTAGVSFLFLGMVVFVFGWVEFLVGVRESLPKAVLVLMNELLLVVILLELFRTIINFLKSRTISLEPFLHVGIIASVRRLLTIGAEITLQVEVSPVRFNQYLLDALVNVGVILTLVFALYLYRVRGIKAEYMVKG
ncbi:MAG TPA: phosphate-starvation-inducible PsiE family protein [Nitrospiria bacterium]|nr:phosphate-starvation-inducible PsiE family protein [Nitrospiria bacterium]HUK55604.1 phosphate-starvation-inducible PsiE family protein [Nitrospiria bacterium]